MANKSSGKTYTSKSERRSSIRTKNVDPAKRLLNQMDALQKGKDIVLTMPNPNKNETNRKFIKQRVSGRDWVKRHQSFRLAGGPSD